MLKNLFTKIGGSGDTPVDKVEVKETTTMDTIQPEEGRRLINPDRYTYSIVKNDEDLKEYKYNWLKAWNTTETREYNRGNTKGIYQKNTIYPSGRDGYLHSDIDKCHLYFYKAYAPIKLTDEVKAIIEDTENNTRGGKILIDPDNKIIFSSRKIAELENTQIIPTDLNYPICGFIYIEGVTDDTH